MNAFHSVRPPGAASIHTTAASHVGMANAQRNFLSKYAELFFSFEKLIVIFFFALGNKSCVADVYG